MKRERLETEEDISRFLSLPKEVREQILNKLSPFEVYAATNSNEQFRQETLYLWKIWFKRDFGNFKLVVGSSAMWNYLGHYLFRNKSSQGFGNYHLHWDSLNITFRPIAGNFIIENESPTIDYNDWIFEKIISYCYLKLKSSISSNLRFHEITERDEFKAVQIIVKLFQLGFSLKAPNVDFYIRCVLCDKKAEYKCSGNDKVVYCGSECQAKHWEIHKDTCY